MADEVREWKDAIGRDDRREAMRAQKEETVTPSLPTYNYDQAHQLLFRYSDSYTRLKMLLRFSHAMPDGDEWLRLLGENWPSCDNISEHMVDLRVLIPQNGPCLQMMDEDEKRRWNELPEIVTIYRGCGIRNINGISWTLDRAIAESFPTLNRYKVPDPYLITATVNKNDIVADKLGRQEAEVITFRANVVTLEELKIKKVSAALSKVKERGQRGMS
jgi:hypothetical protein